MTGGTFGVNTPIKVRIPFDDRDMLQMEPSIGCFTSVKHFMLNGYLLLTDIAGGATFPRSPAVGVVVIFCGTLNDFLAICRSYDFQAAIVTWGWRRQRQPANDEGKHQDEPLKKLCLPLHLHPSFVRLNSPLRTLSCQHQ